MKVFINPNPERAGTNNGIGRVIKAQYDYLPSFGVEITNDPNQADIIAAHIHAIGLPRVDVLHCHGLHWAEFTTPATELYDSQVNRAVLEAAKAAKVITVPSEWVAMPFKRDMRLSPEVIGHGIDLAEWKPLPQEARKGYILWNKNRWDSVCDPAPAIELARRGLPVVSTFGDSSVMQVTGLISYEQMREMVKHADIYLATTKETFGIGTLEALASGIPVLGYAYGGTLDIVRHKVNGYLARPGDIDDLVTGYKWLKSNLQKVSKAAVKSAKGYDWKNIIGKYATLYKEVYAAKQKPNRVAVVIPNHNYKGYVGGAIESCLNQSKKPDQIIVVDDASTDGSLDFLQSFSGNPNIKVISLPENMGVAAARNTGIMATNADYIVCLDADDWIEPGYIETLANTLQSNPTLGVAYTGLKIHFPSGEPGQSNWPPEFDFDGMTNVTNPPSNCVPVAAMFRREMWERAGGYLQEHAPGEDTEFFLRGLSLGFDGKRVTGAPLFNYRVHEGSHSRTKTYKPINAHHPWMVDKQFPMAAPTKVQSPVRSYSQPLVSVIIPVGPGHAKYLPEALNSLLGQTFRDWEVIVVDDSWEVINDNLVNEVDLTAYPFAKDYPTPLGAMGAGVARNIGLFYATAPLVLFLDSDDWLDPQALEKMIKAYTQAEGRYIYTAWKAHNNPDEIMGCLEYDPMLVLEKRGIHSVTVLMSTEDARRVGGFDETLPSWEDNEFFMRCATQGVWGKYLNEALLTYRVSSSTRRMLAVGKPLGQELATTFDEKYKQYLTGEKPIMACCGGGANQPVVNAFNSFANMAKPAATDGTIQLEFIGVQTAPITCRVNGRAYAGANSPTDKYVNAAPQDVDQLLQLGVWRIAE